LSQFHVLPGPGSESSLHEPGPAGSSGGAKELEERNPEMGFQKKHRSDQLAERVNRGCLTRVHAGNP
jgi:hypothetical protein